MARLSDRAFQIVKNEIERRYSDNPEDQIERVILLSRLETLRAAKGKPMTRIQIWEVLSDIAPNFDQSVLMDAESVETDSPIVGASMGVGAVAMLVAAAIGMEQITNTSTAADTASPSVPIEQPVEQSIDPSVSPADEPAADAEPAIRINSNPTTEKTSEKVGGLPQLLSSFLTRSETPNDQGSNASKNALKVEPKTPAAKVLQKKVKRGRINYFEAAKGFGWQAALKSQNPPHSHNHWAEAATLWTLAISHLEQVPPADAKYMEAQIKKALYRQNLQQVKVRQMTALKRSGMAQAIATSAPAQSRTESRTVVQTATATKTAVSSAKPGNNPTADPNAVQTPQFSDAALEDSLKVAKDYGWKAAVASQNAPHPPEKWADISRLWQAALSNLNKIDTAHPSYAEAQVVKARYQKNLSAIRDRYQTEQAATQRLQSLQATLAELNNSMTPRAAQYSQLEAIVSKLQTIPQGTNAHGQAQPLISKTVGEMNAIASNRSN